MLAVGGGKVYMGSYEWAIYALNTNDGSLAWFKNIDNAIGYTGCFMEGSPNTLIAGCVSGKLYKFNADTGDIIWEYPYGYAGFAAQGGAIGYGMYYEQYFNLDGLHYAAWNITTGQIVWDNLASRTEVSVPYINPAVADGKVWIQVQKQDPNTLQNSVVTACFDAYTGAVLYEIPYGFATPSVAYGNLYAGASNYLWCFGAAKDWSMFRGNAEQPGVAVGQAGPTNLVYKWVYTTDGPVTSSAAVVQGKVYIGSFDKNLYCLDAYTGAKIWSFATADRVLASPAVYCGAVYTGIEDGTMYCLNANTGATIWTKTGFETSDIAYAAAAFSIRSSPIISDGKIYIGSTADYKIYCIDAATGNIVWQYQTNGPVGSSAVVVGGVVYQASTDNYLYALNANTGALIWKSLVPYDNDQPIATVPPFDPSWARSVGRSVFQICSVAPAPDLGLVFITGNRDYRNDTQNVGNFFAFNMTSGEMVWKRIVPGGNFGTASPAYFNGVIYHSFGQYSYGLNATNGNTIWSCWTTFQGFSSPTVADDVGFAKMYYGNGFYTLNVIDTRTGTRTAWQTTGSQIISSPAIWENKVYVGSADFNVYCFLGTAPSL
jgi:outer membrane protein assembly factor BamB